MSDCPFCKRIENREWDSFYPMCDVVDFEPLNPVVPGHRLFLPYKHAEHPDVVATGAAVAAAEQYATNRREEYNLITSAGTAATMSIPHIHVHYVPRSPGDGLMLPWHTEAHDAELREQIAQEIEAAKCHEACGSFYRKGIERAAEIARGKVS